MAPDSRFRTAPSETVLNCGAKLLDLSTPQVMGVLNVTPDSFSDGGNFLSVASAVDQAQKMVGHGAAIIDIGGESTRPGSAVVSVAEELARVIPVIEAIRAESPVIISIDTSKPEVMTAAVAAGANMINDVRALQAAGALEAASKEDVAVCLMHMQGEPRTMQQDPCYDDVVQEVKDFLLKRVEACVKAGIRREQLLIDPGFGFGKSLEHNFRLLKNLGVFCETGLPVLVGMSRKSMIGNVLNAPVDERLFGSISVASIAVWLGASIIRTHDVRATRDAVQMCHAVNTAGL